MAIVYVGVGVGVGVCLRGCVGMGGRVSGCQNQHVKWFSLASVLWPIDGST